VGIQNVTKDLADSLGLGKAQGAVVGNVEEGSPAAKGGLEVGDVILKIDGRNVEGSADLSRTIRGLKPGHQDQPERMAQRQAARRRRDRGGIQGRGSDQDRAAGKNKKPEAKPGKLGVAVIEMTADQKKALKINNGVMVEAADWRALAAGIGPRRRDPAREQRRHHQREVLHRHGRPSSTRRSRWRC
jgi:serine protease Do